MPIKNVTTAGTRVQLVTGATLPTQRYCARLTIQGKPTNAAGWNIYIGLPAPVNSGATVSATVYDVVLNSANPSVTFGMGNSATNDVDAGGVWLDSTNSGDGVDYSMETA